MILTDATQKLKGSGGKALVAFLTAGYPDERSFIALVKAAAAAGSDIIEIGIPFSDPIADGPLIQASSKTALENGNTLTRTLEVIGKLSREIETPLVFMTYYNPILRMGLERFTESSVAAGVTGVIVPDVPFEESDPLRSVVKNTEISRIDLIAPTSNEQRVEQITASAEGFLYLVSVTGVTGVRSADAGELETFANRVRARSSLPLYVGFGISDSARAKEAAAAADGVIIGSALINLIQNGSASGAIERVADFLKEIKMSITPAS